MSFRKQTSISHLTNFLIKKKSPTTNCCADCCSVAKSCPTLCGTVNCSMPGLPALHHLPELAQTHAHWVGDAIQPSHPLVTPFSSCLQSFPASGSFPMSRLFTSGGQSIGASASPSVLPVNIQGWFPLELTGSVSLLYMVKTHVKPLAQLLAHTECYYHC